MNGCPCLLAACRPLGRRGGPSSPAAGRHHRRRPAHRLTLLHQPPFTTTTLAQPFVKVLKNKQYFKRYQVKFRRRRGESDGGMDG